MVFRRGLFARVGLADAPHLACEAHFGGQYATGHLVTIALAQVPALARAA